LRFTSGPGLQPEGGAMHTHNSVLHGAILFTSVLLFGTVWRLVEFHLTANPRTESIGKAMALQY
jgi:hypothetical protein